jgi:hypothetical protein
MKRLGMLAALIAVLAAGAALFSTGQRSEAAYTTIPGYTTTFATYLQTGQALSGARRNTFYVWDDWENAVTTSSFDWAISSSGSSGTSFPVAGTNGGWVGYNTGATAGSTFDLSTQLALVSDSRTQQWYVACRFKVTTAVDAQAVLGCGLDDGAAQTVICGFNGPAHATNFSVQYAGRYTGSAINLNVAADTNVHVCETWAPGDATTLCGRLDGGAATCVAAGASITTAVPRVVVHNGTTATSRTIRMDWYLAISGRSN